MKDLEKEIELLKEKVALLEKVKELQECIDRMNTNPPYVPVVPYYPEPYVPWRHPYPNIIYTMDTTNEHNLQAQN